MFGLYPYDDLGPVRGGIVHEGEVLKCREHVEIDPRHEATRGATAAASTARLCTWMPPSAITGSSGNAAPQANSSNGSAIGRNLSLIKRQVVWAREERVKEPLITSS
jgi:hypothetical protein